MWGSKRGGERGATFLVSFYPVMFIYAKPWGRNSDRRRFLLNGNLERGKREGLGGSIKSTGWSCLVYC